MAIIDYALKFTNRSNKHRTNDKFYVRFLGIPHNDDNILGRYVKSISRPSLDFDQLEASFRGVSMKDRGGARTSPVTITFFDDDEGLVSTVLNAQVFRQIHRSEESSGMLINSKLPTERNYKFDTELDLLNSRGEVVDKYVMKTCYIISLNGTSPMYADGSKSEITITIDFDNLDFPLLENFWAFNPEAKKS